LLQKDLIIMISIHDLQSLCHDNSMAITKHARIRLTERGNHYEMYLLRGRNYPWDND